jgi:hypothetical protein
MTGMNELDLLLKQIRETGITDTQAKKSLQIISLWINEEYPIMGAIVEIWLKEKGLYADKIETDNAQG